MIHQEPRGNCRSMNQELSIDKWYWQRIVKIYGDKVHPDNDRPPYYRRETALQPIAGAACMIIGGWIGWVCCRSVRRRSSRGIMILMGWSVLDVKTSGLLRQPRGCTQQRHHRTRDTLPWYVAIINHSEAEITWWLPCFFGDERMKGVRPAIVDSTRAQCSTYVAGTKNKQVIHLNPFDQKSP